MKSKILFAAALLTACAFSMSVNAQLEVKTSGDVEIGQNLDVISDVQVGEDLSVANNVVIGNDLSVTKEVTFGKNLTVAKDMALGTATINNHIALNIYKTTFGTITPCYGVKSYLNMANTMPTSPLYAVYGVADAVSVSAMVTSYPLVGVYGEARKLPAYSTVFAAGIVGVASYYGGIGVYGKANYAGSMPTSMPSGSYAGYFDGRVSVLGTLSATVISTPSSINRSEQVEISCTTADNVLSLNPVSYIQMQDSTSNIGEADRAVSGKHYGLIAEDVKRLFPDIVYENDGELSINYIELIPILIKEIQQLSDEVNKLKGTQKNSNE